MSNKSIVIFGGSSATGQIISKALITQGCDVINVDHNKSEVEGVIRYPYDAGTSQTRGILRLVNPDLIVVCDVFDDSDEISVLNYVSKLCAVLSHCVEQNVEKIVVNNHSDLIDNIVESLNEFSGIPVLMADDNDMLSTVLKEVS